MAPGHDPEAGHGPSVIDPLAFIESVEWTFASSMPWNPHWYIVKHKVDRRSFDELALHIRLQGRLGVWANSHLHWYLHLPDHGFYYWTMGAPLSETIIINRARVETDNVRYLEDDQLAPPALIERWATSTECPSCLTLDPITQEWETEDLFGLYGTKLISLQCPDCGYRYL